ncbi:hypothetical protein DV515_00005816, partial [Chloebia gouldiae]
MTIQAQSSQERWPVRTSAPVLQEAASKQLSGHRDEREAGKNHPRQQFKAPQPVQSEGFTPAPERAALREQLINSRLISLANALGLRNPFHLRG